MGGVGSGRYGTGRKRMTCEALRVDVGYLARHNMLAPGQLTPLTWTCHGELCGSIHLYAHAERIVLYFRVRVDGGEWKSCSQSVPLVTVPTNFGHRRLFRCPTCGRACRDLYSGRTSFACRKCLRLLYFSQFQADWERATDQARALRRRVGAPETGLLTKPRRMRWRTYRRLIARDAALTERWVGGMMASADRLQGRLRRWKV